MRNSTRLMLMLLAMGGLSGCNTDPSTRVSQPMTIRPNPVPQITQADGAIYHAATSRPLFEDRRARFVGDTLTVNLVEKNSANRKSNGSSSRSGSANVAVGTPTILGYTPRRLPQISLPGANNDLNNAATQTNIDTSFVASSSMKNESKEDNSNSNSFSGSITVTVIEVLPNGNLAVSGEKQVSINETTEFIRLSGIVNPIHITAANTVNSTQIADARIETKGKQSVDTAQVISMLSRFFIALLPF
ncbi:MAG: flagellar basal body L-ring protein FlgH [Methylophilaceae bacterium]|nr:flagellar basal body L-ring protein FlgH [Methylophilaceae bacterium]